MPLLTSNCRRECAFCQEFDGSGRSIYHEMLGRELPSRVVHRTRHFVVFPPLGEFIEGGLLLATREHRISMAALPEAFYDDLEAPDGRDLRSLGGALRDPAAALRARPGGPRRQGHLLRGSRPSERISARVNVHAQLRKFPHAEIGPHVRLVRAAGLRTRPYLFLQANEGRRFVYDAGIVPSQYVRRIVATALGMPERWHWREYPGLDELKRTFEALSGWSPNPQSVIPIPNPRPKT